jgi:UDP-glucose 4-epimerase
MKRILITGGAGFIGSHCVDLFLSQGYAVGVFDIKTSEEAVNLSHCMDSIVYIQGDIRELRQLDAVMGEYSHVLHLAADVSVQNSIERPLETHETNVTGTLNVLHCAATHDIVRVVYASSAAVYGDTQTVPTHEEVTLLPLSPYGLHKVFNEQYAQLYALQYGLQTTGLRFFNVYGSRQDPTSPYSGVISIFHNHMSKGERPYVYGDGQATRDFIHVSDVALACAAALGSSKAGASLYNVGTGTVVSIGMLIETLNQVLQSAQEPIFKDPRAGDIMHSCAVVIALQTDFDTQTPKELEVGLQELLQNS